MIERYLRTFMIKILFFISSNLLSKKEIEVDTQQLNVPICIIRKIITNYILLTNIFYVIMYMDEGSFIQQKKRSI